MASTAEASKTQVRPSVGGIYLAFPLGLGPPLRKELIRETNSGGDVRKAPAYSLEYHFTLFQNEALILDDGHEDISRSDPQFAADFGRDHKTALGPDRNFR